MTVYDAIVESVSVEGLIVMAACFVAVVWWGFRGRHNGDSGGSDGDPWDAGDDGGDGGGD